MTREASGTLKELKGQDMIKHEKCQKREPLLKVIPNSNTFRISGD